MSCVRALLLLAAAMALTAAADARSVFFHQRMLRQATGAINGPLASSINDASSLYNISGVWVGIGDQYDAAVWAAYFEEGTLPACGDAGNFTYKHWDETLPDSIALAANNTGPAGFGINGHETGTYILSELTYDGQYLTYKPDWAPTEVSCARFVPYIDHRNGYVYASMITKTEWKKSGDEVEFTDLSCTVKDTEVAGCYPQKPGVVHSVSVTSYRCAAGVCAGYAPAAVEKGDE